MASYVFSQNPDSEEFFGNGRQESLIQEAIPGTNGQPHTTIVGGGHFLQEDRGEELAKVVVDFIARTSR